MSKYNIDGGEITKDGKRLSTVGIVSELRRQRAEMAAKDILIRTLKLRLTEVREDTKDVLLSIPPIGKGM